MGFEKRHVNGFLSVPKWEKELASLQVVVGCRQRDAHITHWSADECCDWALDLENQPRNADGDKAMSEAHHCTGE
jgi:hypothetical protein